MKIITSILFVLKISLDISFASIELCGVDLENPNLNRLNNCRANQTKLSIKQQYTCYLDVYEQAINELQSSSVFERSPELRTFLTTTRKNFNLEDDPNIILNYYETTELYRLSKECQDGNIAIYQTSESETTSLEYISCPYPVEKADSAITAAKELQSAHHALFESGKILNDLKGMLTPPVQRDFRSEQEPLAFNDCKNGYPPGPYPPKAYIERVKERTLDLDEDELGCPDWVQHQVNCETSPSPLEEVNESIMIFDFFKLGVEVQLQAFSEQILTKNPRTLTENYKRRVAKKN